MKICKYCGSSIFNSICQICNELRPEDVCQECHAELVHNKLCMKNNVLFGTRPKYNGEDGGHIPFIPSTIRGIPWR